MGFTWLVREAFRVTDSDAGFIGSIKKSESRHRLTRECWVRIVCPSHWIKKIKKIETCSLSLLNYVTMVLWEMLDSNRGPLPQRSGELSMSNHLLTNAPPHLTYHTRSIQSNRIGSIERIPIKFIYQKRMETLKTSISRFYFFKTLMLSNLKIT